MVDKESWNITQNKKEFTDLGYRFNSLAKIPEDEANSIIGGPKKCEEINLLFRVKEKCLSFPGRYYIKN